jgi:hypothetical protein
LLELVQEAIGCRPGHLGCLHEFGDAYSCRVSGFSNREEQAERLSERGLRFHQLRPVAIKSNCPDGNHRSIDFLMAAMRRARQTLASKS